MKELLAIKSDFNRIDEWAEAFADMDIEICLWDEIDDPSTIDYALVWVPEAGALHRFENLKIIFSIGAGLDHLMGPGVLPPNIPVVRMVEDTLTAGMVEYVLYNVLRFHRFMPEYEKNHRRKSWDAILQIPAEQRTVGILGLGVLGQACARVIADLGFNVVGWSRTEKHLDRITSTFGDEQLDEFLAKSEILVCLLPLTRQTRGIINQRTLSKLPNGAYLINAGRGGHQIEVDILSALESGQLAGAALDVFEVEPLPVHSPLWTHANVTITPHVASMTTPFSSAKHVYENIQRFRRSEPLTHLADMEKGY
ncbi:MAG: glyoxylate/hydroxypyruvate reductase A [Gammaproteobacteria bacterium]|nr:glyoxylate/hydroxypyruvate reductase A [Gammaproteobacteria bacterium]NKB65325.1 glyoxylate/hydroxypyruvate reductase A [Gammaproteobacteria bacterium]